MSKIYKSMLILVFFPLLAIAGLSGFNLVNFVGHLLSGLVVGLSVIIPIRYELAAVLADKFKEECIKRYFPAHVFGLFMVCVVMFSLHVGEVFYVIQYSR